MGGVAEYIQALLASPRFGAQVTYHRRLPPVPPAYAETRRPWPRALRAALEERGIAQLYAHQALATDTVRAGRSVVVATPTASGKSLIYTLPVLESLLRDPDAHALYLFPLKALAQDQLAAFQNLTAAWPKDARPAAAIYDGDTSDHFRRKIRLNPPAVLITNPEMLHLALLPHHEQWAAFFAGLTHVVVDEAHTYRGVFGAHMAQVFRRLNRVTGRYGAQPVYIFCTATVGNPAELAASLLGSPPPQEADSTGDEAAGPAARAEAMPPTAQAADTATAALSTATADLSAVSTAVSPAMAVTGTPLPAPLGTATAADTAAAALSTADTTTAALSTPAMAVTSATATAATAAQAAPAPTPPLLPAPSPAGHPSPRRADIPAPVVITRSGAPQGARHFVFINPEDSPATMAISLLKAALARGLRTIVYCRSRRMTELVALWAADKTGPYAGRISAYRAGFLPEERRGIEARMNSGELLAVVSTSALELGIDIGALDVCILVGYPGTVMSTLQRGGRVGRAQQDAAVLLVAGEDALDQYIVRNAPEFFSRPAERAVVNPDNEVILRRHLECAAAEFPLNAGEDWLLRPAVQACLPALLREGKLLLTADGAQYLAARKRPQRHVDLRGCGQTFAIEDGSGTVIGSVDGFRACTETHPGAVYLHHGVSYVVTELDPARALVRAQQMRVSWFTRVRCRKSTDILSVEAGAQAGRGCVFRGRLRITETISGYEKRAVAGNRLLTVVPLDMPPHIFETEGLWFVIPDDIRRDMEDAFLHFMGSIHALEHAAIGMLPLLVMADRNDFGGISIPLHPQLGLPAVFIYDGLPGGAGLSRAGFDMAERLLDVTRRCIADCPCLDGCPSCVHSPKCGSGNRPISKEGALSLLNRLLGSGPRLAPETVLREMDTVPPAAGFLDVPPAAGTAMPTAEGDRRPQPAAALPAAAMPAGTHPAALPTLASSVVPLPASLPASFPPSAAGTAAGTAAPANPAGLLPAPPFTPAAPPARYMVLDVETRRSAAEVGGWHRADRMGVSIAVLYDAADDTYHAYRQEELPAMFTRMAEADVLVGFNSLRFDYNVLQPFCAEPLAALPSLDLLTRITERLSYRVSLDNLGQATFDEPKSADGLQALRWWQEGKLAEITAYCRKDVELTRRLYLHGLAQGYVLFRNKAGQRVRVPVDFCRH